MNCPKCNSEVHTVVDTRDPNEKVTTRRHWCGMKACAIRWNTTEKIDKAPNYTTFPRAEDVVPRKPPSVVFRHTQQTRLEETQQTREESHNGHGGSTQPVGLGGEGVGLSGIQSDPISSLSSPSTLPPDPSLGSDRESDRASGVPGIFREPRRAFPVASKTSAFKEIYRRYPKKYGEMGASAVWVELAAAWPGGEDALRSEILREFDAGMLDRHPYNGEVQHCPKLENFLADRQWTDDWRDESRAPAQKKASGHSPVSADKDYAAGMNLFKKKAAP